MENPRNQISDLHFDKIPYSLDFQCWKTNFKTKVFAPTQVSYNRSVVVKEVDVAESVDDL